MSMSQNIDCLFIKKCKKEFSSGTVVRTQHFHCKGLGSTPGRGTKTLHITWRSQKNPTKPKGQPATVHGPRDDHTQRGRPGRERQVPHGITDTCGLKAKDTKELIHETERLTDTENKLMATKEVRGQAER